MTSPESCQRRWAETWVAAGGALTKRLPAPLLERQSFEEADRPNALTLPGPSRHIRVEPVTLPDPSKEPRPTEKPAEPAPAPERKREPVPER